MDYPIKLKKDDNDTYLVTSLDFPELTTFGESVDEALGYARAALEEAIAARIAHKEDIPSPSKGRYLVRLPTQIALKVLLYQSMRETGVGKAELSRRMHCHLPQIDRLLDLHHASRLDVLDNAFAALGKDVDITLDSRRTQ